MAAPRIPHRCTSPPYASSPCVSQHKISLWAFHPARGRRWVDIQFGPRRLPIEVHEDVLCYHSPYFRNLFQAIRKPLSGDDCCVCEYPLDVTEDNITHCKGCGQNVHNDCIDKWLEKSVRCPLCRAVWAREDRHTKITVDGLDREGFDHWVKYVYGSGLPVLKDVNPDAAAFDAHIVRLMRAFSAANTIKDIDFQDVVTAQIAADIESHGLLPGLFVVRYLFSEMEKEVDFATLRAFVIDVYALKWSAGNNEFWLGNYDLHGVAEFMSCLLIAQSKAKELNLAGKTKPNMDDLVKKHMLTRIGIAGEDESNAIGAVFDAELPTPEENGGGKDEGKPLMKVPGFDIHIPQDRVV